MAKPKPAGALRSELERRLENGRCVYCRAPAAPDRPLTREHVIPQARGGRRKDASIIVPACARCNGRRGCKEFVLFLLARPRRIRSFLEYLDTLPPDCLSQIDLRVVAELYAAIWLLSESTARGVEWRDHLQQLCSGRRLHRRRYAARRLVSTVEQRLHRLRRRSAQPAGPSCLIPRPSGVRNPDDRESSLEDLRAALVTVLSRIWETPAERVLREIAIELHRASTRARKNDAHAATEPETVATTHAFAAIGDARPGGGADEDVLPLNEWTRRRQRRRRRMRTDRRGGRAVRRRAA